MDASLAVKAVIARGKTVRPGLAATRIAVEDVEATLARAEQLGGSIVQPAQHVPGTSVGVFADAQGHKVGVASTG